MKLILGIIIIIVYFLVEIVCWRIGKVKYWIPDLEWSTENNWINGIKPESNSRVVFPFEIYHSVGLPGNSLLQLSGIELSCDGALLLSRDGSLQMSDSKKFKGKISQWKLKGPFYWVDPDNWGGDDQQNKAVPHLERIPCSVDTVVLPDPKNHPISIILPNTNVKVKQIKIGLEEEEEEEAIDEWHWHSLMTYREFHNSPRTISYSGLEYCGEETDCLCKQPENVEELLTEICRIETPKCEQRACEYPLEINDHCCDYCGGRVSVVSGGGGGESIITVTKLSEIAEEALKNNKDIYWHARFTPGSSPELVEILIAERGIYSEIKTQEAIDKLVRRFTAKGILVVKATSAGAPLTGSALANILGPMFGVPIVILIIIILTLPYFGYSYSYVLSVWQEAYGTVKDGMPLFSNKDENKDGFARFDNLPEGDDDNDHPFLQLLSAPSISDNNQQQQQDSGAVVMVVVSSQDNSDPEGGGRGGGGGEGGKRFENPLYRSTRKSQSALLATDSIINIDLPVSLTELNKKVYSSQQQQQQQQDTHIDSD